MFSWVAARAPSICAAGSPGMSRSMKNAIERDPEQDRHCLEKPASGVAKDVQWQYSCAGD